jgi:O-antigen ligase/tetratricopeptide (TPR) repeat protein
LWTETAWAEAACQLAGLLVPLAFHTLGTVGFEATKVLLVRLLGLVLLVGWVGLEASRIGSARGPFHWRGVLGEVWHGPLRWVLLGAVGIALTTALSTASSVSPLVSLLGSWDREQGLATVLACVILGVAATLAGRDPSRRRLLLAVWAIGSAPICVYAFVQFAHLDPVHWLNQPLGVSSTLGSSTALATYLAMLLPLTLACAILASGTLLGRGPVQAPPSRPSRQRGWRGSLGSVLADPRVRYGGWVALLAAQLAALAMTQVRGGVLALAGGLIVTVGVALWPTHRRPVILGGAAALVMLAIALVLFGALPRPDVGDGTDTSAIQRVLVWQDAVQAIAGPRAMIGYGPETQMLALEPHYPIELAQRFPNARWDRAHNLELDALLTTGLLGLLVLGLLVVGVARAGLLAAAQERGPGRWISGALLGALAANLIANQFAFDTAATAALFWMLAGLTVAPLLPAPEPVAEPTPEPAHGQRQSRRRQRRDERRRDEHPGARLAPAVRLRATAFLAAGAIGLSTVPWLTAPFLADLYHTRALGLRAGEAPGSSSREDLAAALAVPWLDVPLLSLGDVYLDLARTSTLTQASAGPINTFQDLVEVSPANRAALFDAARVSIERAIQVNPRDPYPYAMLARHWKMRAEASRDPAEKADLYGQAVAAYDQAIAAGPSRLSFYDESGVALIRSGKPVLGLDRLKEAEHLDRPTAERTARMADAVLALGDTNGARALYEQALALDARSAPAEAGLAALDRAAGDLPSALEHAQRAARYQMRSWQYQRDLALILKDLGQNADALAAARAARRMAPAWELDDLTALIQSVSS